MVVRLCCEIATRREVSRQGNWLVGSARCACGPCPPAQVESDPVGRGGFVGTSVFLRVGTSNYRGMCGLSTVVAKSYLAESTGYLAVLFSLTIN